MSAYDFIAVDDSGEEVSIVARSRSDGRAYDLTFSEADAARINTELEGALHAGD